jgi:hypothetical protein
MTHQHQPPSLFDTSHVKKGRRLRLVTSKKSAPMTRQHQPPSLFDTSRVKKGRRFCAGASIVAALTTALSGGAVAQRAASGLPACSPAAQKDLSSPAAIQCWFKATHGGWRILVRDTHYDTSVYHVGADAVEDAEEIAKAIVAGEGPALGEMVVYVYPEPIATSSRIRRVRWGRTSGYETLDFAGRVPEWILPAQP